MKWVEDFTARGDGTFSESKRGKHAKSPWLLQAPHLQSRAVQWLKEQTSGERAGPKNCSLSRYGARSDRQDYERCSVEWFGSVYIAVVHLVEVCLDGRARPNLSCLQ
jgi:hypothetical protein